MIVHSVGYYRPTLYSPLIKAGSGSDPLILCSWPFGANLNRLTWNSSCISCSESCTIERFAHFSSSPGWNTTGTGISPKSSPPVNRKRDAVKHWIHPKSSNSPAIFDVRALGQPFDYNCYPASYVSSHYCRILCDWRGIVP